MTQITVIQTADMHGRLNMQTSANRDQVMDQPVSQVMTCNPVTVSPDTLATEAIHIMEKKEVDNLPVLDEQGRSVGVVDIQDLLKLRVV